MASIFKRGDRPHYRVSYLDQHGKRHEVSSRTTDKRTAQRIAAKIEAEVALLREGVIDAAQAKLTAENRKPLTAHIEDYLRHCANAEHTAKLIKDRERDLRWIQKASGATRISDLTAEAFEVARAELRSKGRSAVTANQRQANIRAFLNWCVRNGRASTNPLVRVSKLNADADRRYIRRPLTKEELQRLFEVAKERGRLLFYATAFYAGVRRGELGRLRWGDVDLDAATLTIRRGKAKRTDILPLHPDLLELLRQGRPSGCTHEDKLFPELVTNKTRVLDFERAGIPAVDAQGLRADLHSTRMTLHTMLALGGVPVQVAQRLLRHADYRTTQKHYFHVDTNTTGSALRALPSMRPAPEAKSAEGCQQKRHKTERAETPSGASSCSSEEDAIEQPKRRKPLESAKMRKTVQPASTRCNVHGERAQTRLGTDCSTAASVDGQELAHPPAAPSADSTAVGQRRSAAGHVDVRQASDDPDLAVIWRSWSTLPRPLQAAILALVRTSTGERG